MYTGATNLNIQNLLQDWDATTRGMVIQAFRFTLGDVDESFDKVLKPSLTPMLATMLKDTDLENRRLALSTLNSATHNKPNFILPDLPQLIPLVIEDSKIKPALIREVQMGPFKHKVDDGLEVRKVNPSQLPLFMMTSTYHGCRVPMKPCMP